MKLAKAMRAAAVWLWQPAAALPQWTAAERCCRFAPTLRRRMP